jgi:hypothetical protein
MNDRELEAGLRAFYRAQVSETETAPLSLRHDVAAIPAADSPRRRLRGRGRGLTLLAAAALLLVGGAVGSGILRLPWMAPKPSINLETSAEIQAFVLSSSERLAQLPPEAITTLDSHGFMDRIYIDGSGAVRIERYASADATEPTTSMLLSGNSFGRTLIVGPSKVWVEQDEAIGQDPRTYLRALSGLLVINNGSDCAMTQNDLDNGGTAAGWRSVGAASVAGRPAHHLACGGIDVWIDDETRLILRVLQPDSEDPGNPLAGGFGPIEVTQIAFGDQPQALFDFSPPNGVASMSLDAYDALCRPGQDTVAFLDYPPCSGTAPVAEASPTPRPTPTPSATPSAPSGPSDCTIAPTDDGAAGPWTWTPASRTQDWPAPVRPEPAGGASAAPIPPTYIDPSGDDGSNGRSCVDIRDVTANTNQVFFDLMSNPPHNVDPSKAWIAYGVVVDENRDGIPDWRYGIDDLPQIPGDGAAYHRAWRTDLHTGRTDYDAGPRIDHLLRGDPLGEVGDTQFGTNYPAALAAPNVLFRFLATFETTTGTGTEGARFDSPFYVWASEIVDGRVVATDFAPDTGWLIPMPGDTNPGGTYVAHADDRLRLTMTIPNGWTTDGRLMSPSHPDDENTGLEFRVVDQPSEWACDASGNGVKAQIGPTVDDLVSYLEGQPMIRISESTDVTVDGYRGKYVEYTTTLPDDNCHGPEWPLDTRQPGNVGFTQEWILDVNRVRLVIDGFAPKASDPVKAELTRIVDSISIGP